MTDSVRACDLATFASSPATIKDMELNPYEARPGSPPSNGVALIEWLVVIAIGAFAIAATVACWIWLGDFP